MDDPAIISGIEPPVVAVKCCTKCGETKEETEYYIANKATGMRRSRCKRCITNQVLEYGRANPDKVWGNKPENKEKKKEKHREAYHKDPEKYRAMALQSFYKRHDAALALQRQRYQENREVAIAKSLKWNRENPEKVKAWVKANPEKIKAAGKRYRIKNPDAHVHSAGQRRARMRCAKVERIKPGIDKRLMALQKGRCVYCAADLNVAIKHRDHIISLSRGGPHTELNLQLTCKPCNLRKHAKHPLDFAAEMGIVKHPTLVAI